MRYLHAHVSPIQQHHWKGEIIEPALFCPQLLNRQVLAFTLLISSPPSVSRLLSKLHLLPEVVRNIELASVLFLRTAAWGQKKKKKHRRFTSPLACLRMLCTPGERPTARVRHHFLGLPRLFRSNRPAENPKALAGQHGAIDFVPPRIDVNALPLSMLDALAS